MFYVISKSKKSGAEYIHHGGYVFDVENGFYPFEGYKTEGIAKMVMNRLAKRRDEWNKEWSDKNPAWVEDCGYRIEEH